MKEGWGKPLTSLRKYHYFKNGKSLCLRYVCTKVERKRYREFAWDYDFAKRDGFRDPLEMQAWFGDPEEYGEEEYDVISFTLEG